VTEKNLSLAGNNIAVNRYGGFENVQANSKAAISDSLGPSFTGADRDGTTMHSGSNLHSHYMNKGQPNDGRMTGFQVKPQRLTTAQGRKSNYTAQ
jgi:hypothetical protein